LTPFDTPKSPQHKLRCRSTTTFQSSSFTN